MPPHHRKIQSSNFIIGTITLPEDGQVMTETCHARHRVTKHREYKENIIVFFKTKLEASTDCQGLQGKG